MPQSSRIRVLSAVVANKIAAGEVVERPASVLKELIENAFDAGATRLDVKIAAGGRKLVSVSDNGSGMSRDDALLSIERHATSKISDVDDIERVASLGFRGEALPAIASVSRLKITTCEAESDSGTEISISAGKLINVADTGRPQGTTIECRDLFFNVPARRKFLRSHRTELSHSRNAFMLQALSRPDAGMTLQVDGMNAHTLTGGATLEERIAELFGPDYLKKLIAIDMSGGEVCVKGYVSLPEMNRPDRNEQYIFINGRSASAALISHAINESYRTLLPAKRHPSVFLFVVTEPGLVDVNVHPAKREVRFRHPSAVRDAIISAVSAALGSSAAAEHVVEYEPISLRREKVPELKIDDLPPARAFKYPRLPMETPPGGDVAGPDGSGPRGRASGDADRSGRDAPWSWCKVLGQIGGLYVVLETEDGYALMDPHAAHERVLYERYMKQVLSRKVARQGLLSPETIELSSRDAERIKRNLGLLGDMGFGISDFGGNAFMVDCIPSCLDNASVRDVIMEIIGGIEEAGGRGAKDRWMQEAIAQSACKSAVKARDRLTIQEIESLVVELARAEMPYTCPHGRPTLIYTSFSELDKKFGRS